MCIRIQVDQIVRHTHPLVHDRLRTLVLSKIKRIVLIVFGGLVLISNACTNDNVKPADSLTSPTITVISTAKPFESEPSLEFSYREGYISGNNIIVRTAGGALVINQSGEMVRNISNDNYSEVNTFEISDNQVFLGYDQAAAIYNLETENQITLIATTDPKQFNRSSAISDDFSMMYSLNAIYRDGEKKPSVTLPRLPNVMTAEFSPDNTLLLTASAVAGFGTVIWDTRTGKEIQQLNDASTAHAFLSNNGTKAYVIKNADANGGMALLKDKVIHVYDVPTGKEISRMQSDGFIVHVSPVTNDNRIFTGSNDGGLTSWSLESYQKTRQWNLGAEVWSMTLDDRNYLWCGLDNGELIAVNLDTNELNTVAKFHSVIRSIDVRDEMMVLITGHGTRLLITANVQY